MTCQRKYYYRIHQGIVGRTEATAPLFGNAIHTALDSWYTDKDVVKAIEIFKSNYKEDLELDDKRTHKMGEWILNNYHRTYENQPLKLIKTEQSFTLPLPNGNNLIGRIDKIVEWDGMYWLMDHKTTSMLGSSYVKMAEPNLQFRGYTWAAKQLGYPVVGVLLDAILVAKGLLDSSARSRLTPLLRHDIYHSKQHLDEWLDIVTNVQHNIKLSEETNQWTPNFDACTYYGECPYRRICIEEPALRDKVISMEYKINNWDPRREK